MRGGIEADVTVTRLSADRFYLVTGSAFGRHDVTFLLQNAPDDGSVLVDDVGSAYGVLNVCGPRSRELLGSISSDDFSDDGFPYMTGRWTDVGQAPALALRVTYVGELGWELHLPSEYVRDAYDRVLAAGAPYGVRDVGYRAVESLRLEKQYVAWAVDVTADVDPYAAGLGFAVRPDKPGLLAGPVLRALRDAGPGTRLCWFSTDADVTMHGGEMVVHTPTGTLASVRSAGYGHTVGRTVLCAYLPADLADAAGENVFEVEVMDRRYSVTRHDRPLYDPTGSRVRG